VSVCVCHVGSVAARHVVSCRVEHVLANQAGEQGSTPPRNTRSTRTVSPIIHPGTVSCVVVRFAESVRAVICVDACIRFETGIPAEQRGSLSLKRNNSGNKEPLCSWPGDDTAYVLLSSSNNNNEKNDGDGVVFSSPAKWVESRSIGCLVPSLSLHYHRLGSSACAFEIRHIERKHRVPASKRTNEG